MCLAPILTLPLALALSVPLAAQELAVEVSTLDGRVSEAISLGFDGQVEQANRELLALAAEADSLAESAAMSDGDRAAALRIAGHAWYYAAQNHDPEWNDEAGQALEVEWLSKALDRLERSRALDAANFQSSYEYRGVTGQLWQHGERLQDERWVTWSAARVAANRLRVEEYGDDYFEKNMLAEALFDHGWITGEKAMLAEAEELAASIPDDELKYGVREKRKAIAESRAPY
ncbi:MAG: hypothetical protein H6918_11015 [Sphingomonadaceae bacterium]|nr:hypothetical protein [Sphingomonadaceae bacterium]